MLKVIGRRLLISIPLLFAVSIITFVLEWFIPGDPARAILGLNGTPQEYQQLRAQMHLGAPVWVQWWSYIKGVFSGNLGTSIFTGQPVTHILGSRLPVTLSLLIGATLLSAVIGVLLGVLSAVRGGVVSRIVDVVSLLGLAVPNFWLGLLLIAAFAISLRIFPAVGYVPFTTSPGQWIRSLVLPVVALGVGGIAQISKIARDGIRDALDQSYIRTLRACGIRRRSLIWKHALKNVGVPLLTVISLVFIGSLSGSVVVETVFVIPGLGSMIVTATTQHDIPVVQGITLSFAVIVIIMNLLTDLCYTWLNPKVRTS